MLSHGPNVCTSPAAPGSPPRVRAVRAQWQGEKSVYDNKWRRLAFCVGAFPVRGCSAGICPRGADSSLETHEGRYEGCRARPVTVGQSD